MLLPIGYADKDVYVSESRYNTRHRWFKKIKIWEGAEKEATLIQREVIFNKNTNLSHDIFYGLSNLIKIINLIK